MNNVCQRQDDLDMAPIQKPLTMTIVNSQALRTLESHKQMVMILWGLFLSCVAASKLSPNRTNMILEANLYAAVLPEFEIV